MFNFRSLITVCLGVFFLVSILLETLCFLDLVDYFLSQVRVLLCCAVLSCVRLFATHGLLPTRILCPQNFLGKNTRVDYHLLYQRIFLTQGSNPCLLRLLHCWKFPDIISSNIFFRSFSLSSPSRTPTMRMVVHFMWSRCLLYRHFFFFFSIFYFGAVIPTILSSMSLIWSSASVFCY